jgi:hypothetical protein
VRDRRLTIGLLAAVLGTNAACAEFSAPRAIWFVVGTGIIAGSVVIPVRLVANALTRWQKRGVSLEHKAAVATTCPRDDDFDGFK